jgi:pyrroloquinoline-quinone synthase
MIIRTLQEELQILHLLNHPFYKAWSSGDLNIDILKKYAAQYYNHVSNFTRYIATIYTKCSDIKSRQILLDNLIDEEKGEENHPELWLRFAEGLGMNRIDVENSSLKHETKNLVEGFFDICNTGYAHGLGALYAYERQVPEIAKSKIGGLKKFYGITSERALKFFQVHIAADEWHSEECENLIQKFNERDRENAKTGAIRAAKLLWSFLDGINEEVKYC